MIWTVLIASPARKQRARFPARDQVRVSAAIAQIAENPSTGNMLKLEGEGSRWSPCWQLPNLLSVEPETHTDQAPDLPDLLILNPFISSREEIRDTQIR
jgi:hypothetical protein